LADYRSTTTACGAGFKGADAYEKSPHHPQVMAKLEIVLGY
jgi:hypothetical protein